MVPNKSEQTAPTPATSQLLLRSLVLGGVAILILILVVAAFLQLRAASYARLSPMSVSLELSYLNEQAFANEVILEYDYGYGFIPAHRQIQTIQGGQQPKVIEFSISSWKPTRGLRLSVKEEQGVVPYAVTFSKLDESARVLLSGVESGVLLSVEDVSLLFSETLISSNENRVN